MKWFISIILAVAWSSGCLYLMWLLIRFWLDYTEKSVHGDALWLAGFPVFVVLVGVTLFGAILIATMGDSEVQP